MEKLFSLNKFFLFFCAIFVFEWLALQVVGYMRLTSLGKLDGEKILGWTWPAKNTKSVIQIYDTKVLKHDNNDAVIKVLAKQAIEPINSPSQESKLNSKCAATLTYYRTNSQWFLAKVECE